MARVDIGIQQPPLPRYTIGTPLVLNYLNSPHPTLDERWKTSSALGERTLRRDEDRHYLRFVRTGSGPATIIVNEASLGIPAGTFDVSVWLRVSSAQSGCTLGLREGTSQATEDQFTGASFTAATGGWVQAVASVTIAARADWTFILRLGSGAIGDVIDVRTAAIMPNGQAPIFGDQTVELGSTDFFYWEGGFNDSRSVRTTRTLANEPGPLYVVENLTAYTITEAATPLSPADTSGGATTVQVGIEDFDQGMLLAGAELTVYDDGHPIVQGRIDSPSSDGDTISITSMSILSRLNVVRRVAPFVGTLDEYIATLMASVGVARPLVVDPDVSRRQIVAHGFVDNVLSRVKEFCSAQGVELSDRGDSVMLRTPRTRLLRTEETTARGMSSDASQLARSVEVINHNSVYLENTLVYPPASYDSSTDTMTRAGWTPEVPILTVASGSVATYEVPILGSLVSVEQPVCVKVVGPDDGYEGSVYSVIGQGDVSDGMESIETLDPEQWEALGGSVTVEVGENFDTLIITISSGMNERLYGPYAIAMNAGSNTFYSSLRIRGTGIVDFKEKIVYPTGLTEDEAESEVGATIDSPYVQNRAQADRVALETVTRYSAPSVTVTGGGDNIGFEPGDIAGTRLRRGDGMFRIISAESGPGGVTFTAAADTTMADFDELWEDMDFEDFDAVWEDRTFDQFGAAPLADG